MLQITFKTSNAAFDGDSRDAEIARILRAIADYCEAGKIEHFGKMIFDANGNNIGLVTLK